MALWDYTRLLQDHLIYAFIVNSKFPFLLAYSSTEWNYKPKVKAVIMGLKFSTSVLQKSYFYLTIVKNAKYTTHDLSWFFSTLMWVTQTQTSFKSFLTLKMRRITCLSIFPSLLLGHSKAFIIFCNWYYFCARNIS